MTKRLYLIDGTSLYQTAKARYRGKLDYAILMENLSERSPEDFEAVLFHDEPPNGGSQVFQNLVKSLGYRLVVIPPWKVAGTIGSSRSLPVHLAAYLMSRVAKYTHFDFVSGEVDYSPLSSYLISTGAEVRFWLFADRIPSYPQGDAVFHSIVPLNESYILSQEPSQRQGSMQLPEIMDRPLTPRGCVELEPSESKVVKVEVPGFTAAKPQPQDKAPAEKPKSLVELLDSNVKPPKGSIDI